MLACADSDPKIASVNPLTNHASEISIPIAPGANFMSMDWHISKITERKYPDIVTGVGFCMMLRRSALNDVGLFDEIYGHGYCEESDLCMRLTTSGYRTVVSDDVYVFHKGSVSFKDRSQRYRKNRKIFDDRWLSIYKKQYKEFRNSDPLKYLQDQFKLPQRLSPLRSLRESYRKIRDLYREKDYLGITKSVIRGVAELPINTENIVSKEYVENITPPEKVTVTYVLHNITIAGGVISVIQLVNELILLGVEARIVALYQYPETKIFKLYTAPIIYKNASELVKNFPNSDIVVATHWTTAEWVSEIVSSGKARVGVYFLQDYESWFFPKSDRDAQAKVKNTYNMIENKIVKSSWLQDLLQKDGFHAKKIWLGIDLGVFYPREIKKRHKNVILAMARPRTPRRGFDTLISALTIVKNQRMDVEVILFGDDLSKHKIPFKYINRGVISDQEELAELYSTADIFIDASDFQGFGRTAIEAMACGSACILTNVGGVNEYAENECNCLLIPPKKPQILAHAIFRLIDDKELRKKIVNAAFETANKFSHKREARNTLAYFKGLLEH